MAKITIVTEVCDLCDPEDRVPAVEPVTVTMANGARFINDVCQEHKDVLREGRRITAPAKKAAKSSKRAAKRVDLGDAREWARANGFTVSDRGMIPRDVREAYEAARTTR